MWQDWGIILWKEYRAYVGDWLNRSAVLLIFAVLAGIVLPNLLISDPQLHPLLSQFADTIALVTTYMCAAIVSDSSFGSERRQGTLQIMLASSLHPEALFLGKWTTLLIQSAAMLLFILFCAHVVLWIRLSTPWLTYDDFWFSVGAIPLGLCACSWIIAANSTTSLWIQDPQSTKLIGGLLSMAPYLIGIGVYHLLGISLGVTWAAIVGAVCIVLAIASFGLGLVAFRSEKVRL